MHAHLVSKAGVVPNFDPCQIITPLVLVGLGLGVGEGLGLGVGIWISWRITVIKICDPGPQNQF